MDSERHLQLNGYSEKSKENCERGRYSKNWKDLSKLPREFSACLIPNQKEERHVHPGRPRTRGRSDVHALAR